MTKSETIHTQRHSSIVESRIEIAVGEDTANLSFL